MRYAKELAFSSPEPFVSRGHVILPGDENEHTSAGKLAQISSGFFLFYSSGTERIFASCSCLCF